MIASTYPRFAGDGAGRFVQSIAEAVGGLGHEVHVLAPYHPSVRAFESPVRLHHFRYIWPDSAAVMGYAQAMHSDRQLRGAAYVQIVPFLMSGMLALRRLMAAHCFDVLHAHWVIPNGAIAAPLAAARHTPLVVSLHGSDVFVALRRPAFGMVARSVFSRARAVTACSPDLSAGARALGAPAEHTHLVPWGADPHVFGGAPDVSGLRQRLGLRPDEMVVLGLGRLVEKKGFGYLIQAAPDVLAAVPRARFVIVGDGPERQALGRLAEELGIGSRVIFTGSVSWQDVPAYLHLCAVFAVPSVHDADGNVDGLPTTILEAMAAGRPVVGSRVAGIPLVLAEGETGELVEEGQAGPLAGALVRLLSQPELRRRYGQAARRRIETELSWEHVARRFVALYQGALYQGTPDGSGS